MTDPLTLQHVHSGICEVLQGQRIVVFESLGEGFGEFRLQSRVAWLLGAETKVSIVSADENM